jgi:hypothetical protein
MRNTIYSPLEKTAGHESLYFASSILLEVNQIVRGVHVIAEVLLRYAAIGTAITDGLIDMITFTPSGEA